MSGLDADQRVDVAWRETAGGQDLVTDTNYGIEQGTVDTNSDQNSILTIKLAKITTLSGTSITYKCAATSRQYSWSAESPELDVVGNVKTFGKIIT